ncbi:MAG TPA: hypothetical protein VIM28_02605 [Solirubrobacterales bacterium]
MRSVAGIGITIVLGYVIEAVWMVGVSSALVRIARNGSEVRSA